MSCNGQVVYADGRTVSDAVRLLLTRVAAEKVLPFDVLIPNDATIAAMRDAQIWQHVVFRKRGVAFESFQCGRLNARVSLSATINESADAVTRAHCSMILSLSC